MQLSFKQRIILTSIVGVFLLAGIALTLSLGKETVIGSVARGGEYTATTTTDASWPSATAFKTIRTGAGTLGSIVVASSSALVTPNYSIACYDSSVSTTTASSTLIRISNTAVSGTYTLDADFRAGLICDTPSGFNGAYTITWRER